MLNPDKITDIGVGPFKNRVPASKSTYSSSAMKVRRKEVYVVSYMNWETSHIGFLIRK